MFVYGAWELKTGYQRYLAYGFGSSLGLFFCAVLVGYLFNRMSAPALNRNVHNVVISLTPSISKPLNMSPSRPVRPPSLPVQPPKKNRLMVDSLFQATGLEWSEGPLFANDGLSKMGLAGVGEKAEDLSDSTVERVIDLDEFNLKPVILFKVDPKCPELARRGRIAGTVTAGLLVGKDGLVKEVSISKSTNVIFDEEVLAALRLWVFRPWVERNRCLPFRFTVMVEFVLRGHT